MKETKFIKRGMRTKLFSALSVFLIIFVFVTNLILSYYSVQKGMYVDLTNEGLYTLTDTMIRECSFVEELDDKEADGSDRKVEITFCADPDTLLASQITRVPYLMALQLDERFENIEVKCENIVYNPTSVSKYKPTSLSTIDVGDVIISYGSRYRIQKPISFWGTNSSTIVSYDGEYKMASFIMSVTAIERPTAYFVVGHGETYYDTANPSREENNEALALYNLLTERGLDVKTVNLEEEGGVPDDCILLIINNPREDYHIDPDKLSDLSYQSELEMIERYLTERQGSVMVARDHEQLEGGKLRHPNLDVFLHDWGFDFKDVVVEDEENHLESKDGSYTTIIGEYSTSEESYGALVYSNFASLPSAANTVFKNAGYITTSYIEGGACHEPGALSAERMFMSFMDTHSTARALAKNQEGKYTDPENAGALTLAAVTGRYLLNSVTGEPTRSSIFCVNSKDFFSNEILGNYSYANHEIVSLLMEEMLFNDKYASNELGGSSMNFDAYGGKILVDTTIKVPTAAELEVNAFPIILFTLPIAALVLGVVVYTKRRFL